MTLPTNSPVTDSNGISRVLNRCSKRRQTQSTSTESEQTRQKQPTQLPMMRTFDVDTIFTSGTFEIAGGGGNPDDSIFQGEINLAQMKMTEMKILVSEFWQASGSLGIDLNGLDISGTVDEAFYRAGRTGPWICSLSFQRSDHRMHSQIPLRPKRPQKTLQMTGRLMSTPSSHQAPLK